MYRIVSLRGKRSTNTARLPMIFALDRFGGRYPLREHETANATHTNEGLHHCLDTPRAEINARNSRHTKKYETSTSEFVDALSANIGTYPSRMLSSVAVNQASV